MLIGAAGQSQPTLGNVLFVPRSKYTLVHRQEVQGYLERIKVRGRDRAADLQTLNLLQRQHLLNVPFENLDIHWNRPIVLNTDSFYRKVIVDGRGGFCYELNGLFNELLREIGFTTRLISARVFHDDGSTGPEFDHAAIIVTIGSDEYLADVGFGDFTVKPLRLVLDEEQKDPAGMFVIKPHDNDVLAVSKREEGNWKGEHAFKDIARELSDFAEMCDFQQYSPESHFTKGKVCSILTEGGRKTLTDTKFIVTKGGVKTETQVASDEAFDEILMREFQISRPA